MASPLPPSAMGSAAIGSGPTRTPQEELPRSTHTEPEGESPTNRARLPGVIQMQRRSQPYLKRRKANNAGVTRFVEAFSPKVLHFLQTSERGRASLCYLTTISFPLEKKILKMRLKGTAASYMYCSVHYFSLSFRKSTECWFGISYSASPGPNASMTQVTETDPSLPRSMTKTGAGSKAEAEEVGRVGGGRSARGRGLGEGFAVVVVVVVVVVEVVVTIS